MTISSNVLTNAGLTKIQLPSLDSSNHKIRLYRRSTQNSGTLIRVQEALEQQLKKGKRYDGNLSKWDHDAREKPYLLKEGKILKWISEEYALELQSNPSSLIEVKQNSLQDSVNLEKDDNISYKTMESCNLNSSKTLNHDEDSDFISEDRKKIDSYEKDLTIAISLKDSEGERKAYCNLGKIYYLLGECHKAIDFYEKALAIAIDFQELKEAGRVYNSLGQVYKFLGEFHKAIELHEKALAIACNLKDREEEGEGYNNLGQVYKSLGEYGKAIQIHKKALEIALDLQDREGEGIAYCNLGNTYRSLGEYHKAIECHEKDLAIALDFKDKGGEGMAYCNLGCSYSFLGEHSKAIKQYEKHLKIALDFQDRRGIQNAYNNLGCAYGSLGEHRRAIHFQKQALEIALDLQDNIGAGGNYGNLGNAYYSLGEYPEAIEFYEKHLKIANDLQDRVEAEKAYNNLGNIYRLLGQYLKAIECHEKALKIANDLQDRLGIGKTYSNLGNIYHSLGESRKAIEFYEKRLKIAVDLQDPIGEAGAYNNLGNAYHSLGEYDKIIEYQENALKISLKMEDHVGAGITYGNLGNAYHSLGNYDKAIEFHIKRLNIAINFEDREGEERANNNLGNVYNALKNYKTAIDFYKKALEIALNIKDSVGEGTAYHNLGNAYYSLKEYEQAKEALYESIQNAAALQKGVKKSQWQITLFERLSSPYILLEKTLFRQMKTIEALEISDRRRTRALTFLITEKLPSNLTETLSIDFLTFKEIKDLAKKLHTTFITYSLADFEDNQSIQAWIISPDQNQELISIALSSHLEEFKDIDTILKIFPYGLRPKAQRGVKAIDPFKERLSRWYELLIAPLASYLPGSDSGQTLTFIPDNFLAHLPFGAFYNKAKNQYLIEKYPISAAPSIKVLSLLDKLPKLPADQALIIGNPTTPIEADNQLKFTRIEVEEINQLFYQKRTSESLIQTQTFTETLATAENILREAPLFHLLHITGHGVMDEPPGENLDPGFDPHSVFKGLFKLAKDDKHSLGQFRSKEIADMTLKADLVFMSACHLGRGNLKREGSIGPIWSFLGAGAKSTVASYWPLPDSQVTVKMVKTFYQHFLGIETPGVSKAHALREAILVGMQENRDNIEQWGAFFLSGLMN